MNQRISRNSKKNNKLDFVSLNMGGLTARHAPNEAPQVQVPQKVTGESQPDAMPGVAKASPKFKPIADSKLKTDVQAEKKAIAENSTPIENEDTDKVTPQ